MERTVYLDRLLAKFGSSFDIYIPYKIKGIEYPAYAYHYTHQEKYVLVKEANMWSADSYEYVLFADFQISIYRIYKGILQRILLAKRGEIIRNFHKECYRRQNNYNIVKTIIITIYNFLKQKCFSKRSRRTQK